MAVEIASAYVSIVPTTKGIQANLEKELSPLSGAASKAGTDSGKALGSGFSNSGGLKSAVGDAGKDLSPLPGIAGRAGADSGSALGSSFSGASGGLKSSLGEAEGHFGKFKSGASGALDSVGISSGLMAAGAGAALVGFGVKAVGAFTDTAKAALDLSTSTGLAVEDASRWIAIGDDYGVGAGALATGLGKIAKTMDSTKWADYGIATRDAGGQARDVNDILLDTFDKLSSVENETDKARIGQELFGKGYQSLTPILGHTRAEYEKMLATQMKGQVITEAEAGKAEKMRLAQDELHDAIGEVTLAFGQELVALAPVLTALAKLVGLAGDAADAMTGGSSGMQESINSLGAFDDQISRSGHDLAWWSQQVMDGKQSIGEVTTQLHKFDTAAADSTTSTTGYSYALQDVERTAVAAAAEVENSTNSVTGYSYAVQDVERSTKDATAATDAHKRNMQMMADSAKRNLDEIMGKWDALSGDINNDKTWINVQASFDELKVKFDEAGKAGKKGGEDSEKAYRDAQLAVDDQKLAVIDYSKTFLNLPPERVTKLLALIDAGSFDLVEAQLANLTRNRNASVQIVSRGGAGYGTGSSFASGGWTPGGRVRVGELGPEDVDLPRGSYVHTASDTRSMTSASSLLASIGGGSRSPIVINNNGREFGVADMNHVLAMARLT